MLMGTYRVCPVLLFFFVGYFSKCKGKKGKRVQGFGVWVGGAIDLLLLRFLKLVFMSSGISLLLPLACFDALSFWVTRGSFLIGRQKECKFSERQPSSSCPMPALKRCCSNLHRGMPRSPSACHSQSPPTRIHALA